MTQNVNDTMTVIGCDGDGSAKIILNYKIQFVKNKNNLKHYS